MSRSRDPFYQQILEALEELRSDQGERFQECMGDLLEPRFRGLVPVLGGSDAGMDAAIPDARGEPFALVCTISPRVMDNLTRSLQARLDKEPSATRRVVLATSRWLTPQSRRKLQDRARELGFVPVQIYERRGVANLLYRSPKWAHDLLALSGEPPALSVFPRTRRPLLDLDPVGRERDLTWLRESSGDRLLLGQPGSGKSFLLHRLAIEGWALFVASDDLTAILNAHREQQVRRLIVDDAHARLDLLERLRQARHDSHATFEIVATSWEGEGERVGAAMGTLPTSQVHRLELLTRDEIVEVYRQLGITPRSDVLRELVDLAANKPGLAVTLGTLALQGEGTAVLRGEALRENLVIALHELLGEDAEPLLGALSLGGDRGIELATAAEVLAMDLGKARRLAVGLGAGGVVADTGDGRLAVWPRQLRYALVRSVFFSGAFSIPYRTLLSRAPDQRGSVETLAHSALRGAAVPAGELRELVAASGSVEAWQVLGAMGPMEGEWVVEHYEGRIEDVAAGALTTAPERVIQRLLAESESRVGSERPTSDPLHVLRRWVRDPRDWKATAVPRRQLVAQQAASHVERDGGNAIAAEAAALALSPTLEGTSLDAGAGHTVTIEWALLPASVLQEVAGLWPVVETIFRPLEGATWRHLKTMLWDWLHPEYAARGQEVSDEQRAVMAAFAREVLVAVSERGQYGPGVASSLRRLAETAGLRLGAAADPVFELLFPDTSETLEQEKERADAHQRALEELGREWAQRSPEAVASDLRRYEAAAESVDLRWPRGTVKVARVIAAQPLDPREWATVFLAHDLAGDLVEPFLERAVAARASGWPDLVRDALSHPRARWSAVAVALREGSLPADLEEPVMEAAKDVLQLVETMAMRSELPEARVALLLASPFWPLALAAAVGEWLADPERTVRISLTDLWRQAVLRSRSREYGGEAESTEHLQYWLGAILGSDAELAFAWLQARLHDADIPPWIDGERGPFALALAALGSQQRQDLVTTLRPDIVLADLIPSLIGRDVLVYQALLARQDLAAHHLHPLFGPPAEGWADLARLALAAGHSAVDVARAAFRGSHTFWGHGMEHWQQWERAFVELAQHGGSDLQEVATLGLRIARERIEDAEREKRRDEL